MKKLIVFFLLIAFTKVSYTQNLSYDSLLREVKQQQVVLGNYYKKAVTVKSKDSIIACAQFYILRTIANNFFNHWYGTRWSFYGQTRIPKQGSIACGYFVTTVLYDAGFKIPRVQWAQLASEVFIKRFSTDIKRFRDEPIENIKKYVADKSNGLYIVGLDCHVGFILKYNNTIQFIHSSYYNNGMGVVAQDLAGHNPLDDSHYVVIGKILDNKSIIQWLLQAQIK
ncbi:MAG: hypothetical protein V4620_02370 [Bacteroidota bacterium]